MQASQTQHSSGVKQIIAWLDKDGNDTGRRAAIDMCLAARPPNIAHTSFPFCHLHQSRKGPIQAPPPLSDMLQFPASA